MELKMLSANQSTHPLYVTKLTELNVSKLKIRLSPLLQIWVVPPLGALHSGPDTGALKALSHQNVMVQGRILMFLWKSLYWSDPPKTDVSAPPWGWWRKDGCSGAFRSPKTVEDLMLDSVSDLTEMASEISLFSSTISSVLFSRSPSDQLQGSKPPPPTDQMAHSWNTHVSFPCGSCTSVETEPSTGFIPGWFRWRLPDWKRNTSPYKHSDSWGADWSSAKSSTKESDITNTVLFEAPSCTDLSQRAGGVVFNLKSGWSGLAPLSFLQPWLQLPSSPPALTCADAISSWLTVAGSILIIDRVPAPRAADIQSRLKDS